MCIKVEWKIFKNIGFLNVLNVLIVINVKKDGLGPSLLLKGPVKNFV